MRPLRFIALILATGLLAASPARDLAAQIRVPRPKIPNPLSRVTQGASPDTRAPSFDDRVLEITDARVTSLIRGLEIEKRQRPALADGYRRNADARAADAVARRGAEGREEQVSLCFQRSPEYQAVFADTGEAGQAKMVALANRIQALQARGDYNAIQAISDSVTRVASRRDSLLTAARARCDAIPAAKVPTGPPPAEPSRPLADSLRVLGAGGAGLTSDQYAILRERVLAYLSTDEAELRRSLYVFSGGELAVLRARKSDLQRYQSTLAEE
ncbi:MAG TPA: hypothetical protein VG940_05800 [Gemmatimonadales bacterium]|nr:hypothetical protein [Gemmatimonadales bacterium]